jgi:hypothetical protein
MLKKLLVGAGALATAALPIAASAQPFEGGRAERVDYRYRGDRDGDRGAAVAAGLFGMVLGAAIASSHHPDYDDYGYGYAPYGDGYGYAPYAVRCRWETRAYPGPWGSVTYQNVRVCY